jgi:hypothetical protein
VRLLKCVLVGGILVSAGQAYADDDAVSEIRVLKAKLKQLEQRVDDQGRKEKVFEAQAKAMPVAPGAYKALPVDPCAAPGKVCYKGVTLIFGGWIDLTSSTGPATSPPIPDRSTTSFHFSRARISTRRNRVSRRARPGSRSWPKAMRWIRALRVTAKSISKARRRPQIRLRPIRSIRGCASSASPSIAPISAFMSSPAKHSRSMPRAKPASIRPASMRPA